jgi:SSS family solute:Na+ symporter
MEIAVLVALLAYLALCYWVGKGRSETSGEGDFFLADRKIGVWQAGGSLAATVLSGSTFLAGTAFCYARGLAGIWYNLAGGICLILLGLTIAGRVRAAGCFTLPELAGQAYGSSVRWGASAVVIAAEIAWLALLIRAQSAVLETFTTAPALPLTLAVTAVLVAYTMSGGQRGVTASDLFQLGWIALGVAILTWACWGPAATALRTGPAARSSFPLAPGFGMLDLVAIFALLGLPHWVGSDVFSRLLSARDDAVARKAALLAGAIKCLAAASIAVFGLAAAQLFPRLDNPDHTLPLLVRRTLPEPLGLLLLLALLAVLMSTASTVLLTGATVLSRDLLGRFGSGGAVRRARFGMIGLAAAGSVIALHFGQLLPIVFLGYTLFASGLILPVLASFLPPRLRPRPGAALAAIGAGAGIALFLQLTGGSADSNVLWGLSGCGLLLAAGMAWTLVAGPAL